MLSSSSTSVLQPHLPLQPRVVKREKVSVRVVLVGLFLFLLFAVVVAKVCRGRVEILEGGRHRKLDRSWGISLKNGDFALSFPLSPPSHCRLLPHSDKRNTETEIATLSCSCCLSLEIPSSVSVFCLSCGCPLRSAPSPSVVFAIWAVGAITTFCCGTSLRSLIGRWRWGWRELFPLCCRQRPPQSSHLGTPPSQTGPLSLFFSLSLVLLRFLRPSPSPSPSAAARKKRNETGSTLHFQPCFQLTELGPEPE